MDRQAPDPGSTEAALGQAWHDHRRYLLDVAYRMLGSVHEAEDIVQEAFTRLLRVDLATIVDLRGWLVAVVGRLCLDQLRSARSRRETYVGPWLPEPLIPPQGGSVDPADQVTLDDSVRMALLVVLERLTPAERTAFVLHDVFGFSFESVSSIVGRSPLAWRQLASRARHRIQAETGPARFTVAPAEQRRVAERFIVAARGGDLDALMQLLDPDVVGETDTGGLIPGPRHPIVGRLRVARSLLQALRAAQVSFIPMPVNGQPGAIALRDGRVAAVFALTVQHGLIQHIHAIANPYKLAYVTWMLQRNASPADTHRQNAHPIGDETMADDDLPAPARGMVLTVLLIVADQDRSRAFYESVLGTKVVLERDPCILRFHNSWIVLNVGGGPTQDKPTVTMAAPTDPNTASCALNIRVADIHAVYAEWRARGARFLTPPLDRGREIRCYLRDPDGHLIEVGQTT